MKKLFVIISLFLISCASTSDVVVPENVINEPIPKEKDETINDVAIIEEPTPTAPIPNNMYAALDTAIKSQNDDVIQKVSTEILTQNPKDLRALNSMAIVYYKKGRFDAAIFLLNKAIAANNSSFELYNNLGLIHLAKNERREAIKAFRKALEINPRDPIAAANAGAVYTQEKDYNKAAMALEIAAKKNTKDIKILNNYAISLMATGRAKEAGEIYEKLLKDNPSHREAMLNYAILLIENMQKNKEGLDLLNRLKFVGPPPETRETIKNLEIRAKAGLQ